MSPNNLWYRRSFLQAGGAAALGLAWWGCAAPAPTFDRVLQGGMVYREGRYQRQDLALRGGVIVAVEPAITLPPESSVPILDCQHKYIAPGWVDLHVHIGQVGMTIERLGAPMEGR